MQSHTYTLEPTAPFNFKHTLEFLKDFKADGITRSVQDDSLRFAMFVQNQVVVIDVEHADIGLNCTLNAQQLSESLSSETLARVRFYLSLDDDLSDFYTKAQQDDVFKPILKSLYGYHQVKFPTVFSCACWALITQRTPNSFAYKTMSKLSELLGQSITFDGETYTTFPCAQDFLAKNASAAILEATNNTRKTERLLPIAEAFATADETFLHTASFEELATWLKTIHGLGQWSVDYIMLRGLGRKERSPWTDTQIMNSISKVYTQGLSISRGDAKKIAETYGWQQGYWVHYLKHYVER